MVAAVSRPSASVCSRCPAACMRGLAVSLLPPLGVALQWLLGERARSPGPAPAPGCCCCLGTGTSLCPCGRARQSSDLAPSPASAWSRWPCPGLRLVSSRGLLGSGRGRRVSPENSVGALSGGPQSGRPVREPRCAVTASLCAQPLRVTTAELASYHVTSSIVSQPVRTSRGPGLRLLSRAQDDHTCSPLACFVSWRIVSSRKATALPSRSAPDKVRRISDLAVCVWNEQKRACVACLEECLVKFLHGGIFPVILRGGDNEVPAPEQQAASPGPRVTVGDLATRPLCRLTPTVGRGGARACPPEGCLWLSASTPSAVPTPSSRPPAPGAQLGIPIVI
ncbi:unnamed protein product [Nyctereutes procyonoides]|uniref:(raccoon dog) hypothetical protein n=1 Tax=Nyctereutes procyonoides TaxID=34880 RepID=A0A811YPV8_NYCPR|nr:unnamed protein product [Nyctereutes procyonoides]